MPNNLQFHLPTYEELRLLFLLHVDKLSIWGVWIVLKTFKGVTLSSFTDNTVNPEDSQ